MFLTSSSTTSIITTIVFIASFLCSCCIIRYTDAAIRPTVIRLDNNGYSGILLAIHPSVPQDDYLIDDIKDMFIDGSLYLHTATDQRAFFKDVTILVPNTWTHRFGWGAATSQLYQNADIIMQVPPKTRRSDFTTTQSFTRSFGGCGQQGVRINLFTDMFGSRGRYKFGPYGKLLVHEWAHFRWGVFDEFSKEGEPQFYYSPTTGKLEAVRCNIHMVGRIYKKNPQTGRAEICSTPNSKTGVYEEGCVFDPYTNGHFNDNITSSIMDRQKVPTITQFCNDDQSDLKRVHNYESPSRQNRLCQSRSTWAVITESQDFRGGKNHPRQVSDTTPRFTVVRSANHKRMILTIDSSGSMQEDGKLRQARQAATTLLQDGLDDDTLAGVVSFASTARIASPMMIMDSPEVRKYASDSIPREGSEGTNMAQGLIKSLQLMERLEMYDLLPPATFIIILTDGQDTAADSLNGVLRVLNRSMAVVYAISFSDKADKSLIEATTLTGGQFYYDNHHEESTTVMDALLDIFATMDSGTRHRQPVNILSRAASINRKYSMMGKFKMDKTLGCDTSIVLTYTTSSPPDVLITSPTGRRYTSQYLEYQLDPQEKRIKIKIPKLAKIGTWTYSITSKNKEFNKVSFLVLSKGRKLDEEPLRLAGAIWMLDINTTFPLRSQISAEVSRAGHAVVDIKVKAIVERPLTHSVDLFLHDRGAGADAVKGDGVYSRFFNQFSTKGHYSVRLIAYDKDDAVMATSHAGSIYIDHPSLPSDKNYLTQERVIDEYPPMQITDLRVLHTSQANGTVVLSWTAPGDDDDYDQASSYTIALTRTVPDMLHRKNIELLDPSKVIRGDLNSPLHFGEREEMKIKLDFEPAINFSIVLAVYALDDEGNVGDISNLVTAGFGFVPDFTAHDYLGDKDGGTQNGVKEATPHEKIEIAGIVGFFCCVLFLTVVAALGFHVFVVCKKKRKEKQSQNGIQCKIV